ncbi:MFS transporter [Psychromicrobium xiongbiense]|uniref:MFS transporter n=1 Tax=Psychromicrobium xiongbiense TaxID=3051184 RepID=UPI0025563006|nr:MFS transporter [Psychromicrobium sp. YIM S02556]
MALLTRPAAPTTSTAQTAAYWLLVVLLGLVLAVSGVPSPLYGIYSAQWGLSPLMLTLVFAAYAGAALLSLLVVGPLTDALGRKPVLLTAAVMILVGLAIFFTAQNVAALLIARILHGAAIGAVVVAASAALLDLRPHDAARSGRLTGITFSVGMAVGIMGAALLAEYLPAPLLTPFAVVGLLTALMAVGLLLMQETHHQREQSPLRFARPSVPRELSPDFGFSVLGAAGSWMALGLYLSLFPSVAALETGIHSLVFTAGVVAAMTGASALAQGLVSRVPARVLAMIGDVALTVTSLVSIPAVLSGNPTAIMASSIALGVAFGLTFSGSLRHLSSVVPAQARGGVMAAFYLCCYLAMGIPVVLAGWAASVFPLPGVFSGFALIVAVACVLAAVLGLRSHRALSMAG